MPQPVVETADFVLQNGLTVSRRAGDPAGRRCATLLTSNFC